MHKSRIGGIFIDHPPAAFEASLAFWIAATGGMPNSRERDEDDPYREVGTFSGASYVALQRVGDDTVPRVHLDIDTDDVDAEVERLEQLGATRLKSFDDGKYWQMMDPGGLVFCVIPPHTDDFDEKATVWP